MPCQINFNVVPIGERLEAVKFYCDEESFFCFKNVTFDA